MLLLFRSSGRNRLLCARTFRLPRNIRRSVATALSVDETLKLTPYTPRETASKRYFSEHFLPKDREIGILQQLPIFVAAGTAAERESLLYETRFEQSV
jgi:hypothetical protein